jgi:hypothetical protein
MLRKDIEKNYPFISVVTYGGNEYVGIVVNQDQFVTSMLIYSKLRSVEEKKLLLDLGETWWWESNRKIPINIFLRGDWSYFKSTLISLSTKDIQIVHGPCVRLSDIAKKRVKRRTIQLVRRPI